MRESKLLADAVARFAQQLHPEDFLGRPNPITPPNPGERLQPMSALARAERCVRLAVQHFEVRYDVIAGSHLVDAHPRANMPAHQLVRAEIEAHEQLAYDAGFAAGQKTIEAVVEETVRRTLEVMKAAVPA